ncbi:MAG: hypothetical protein NUV77_07305, partial [Thermoguttaceae bacterium]|nr:hypothetical protein [Thermoguttaceae bacterium]
AEIRIPRVFGFIIKYVSPVYLIGVFVLWVRQNLTAPASKNPLYAVATVPLVAGTVVVVGLFCAVLFVCVHRSLRRWERNEQARQEAAP